MYIKEKLKQLPQRPGIYRMLDSLENIIYVGKAKNLKSRVSQYFNQQKNRAPKVAEMIQNIHTFNYKVTDTELDAFIEECRLIKEVKPRYNRQMKNDRKYIYLKIPAELFPKVLKVYEKADDGALYFGPLTSSQRVEAAVQYLNSFYPFRKCSSPRLVRRANGCLFQQLATCLGVCTGKVSSEEYSIYVEKVRLLLNGNDVAPVQELARKLNEAVENLNFEKAAQYSEYYLGLRHVIGKQRLVQSSSKNRNILAVEFTDSTHAKLFLIKGNKLLYGELLNLETTVSKELTQYLKLILIDHFKVEKNNKSSLTQADIDEAQILYSYLKKHRERVKTFWIPSTRLNNEIALEATSIKIVDWLLGESVK